MPRKSVKQENIFEMPIEVMGCLEAFRDTKTLVSTVTEYKGRFGVMVGGRYLIRPVLNKDSAEGITVLFDNFVSNLRLKLALSIKNETKNRIVDVLEKIVDLEKDNA